MLLLVMTSLTACLGIGTKGIEQQVDEEIQPELVKLICDVLGGPIRWSKNDTQETVDQVKVLHNSQWDEFNCEEVTK